MSKSRRIKPAPRTAPSALLLIVGVILIVIAAAAVWYALQPAANASGTGAQVSVTPPRIELGKQPFEKMVTAAFTIANTGGRDLTLDASGPVRALEGC